MYHLSETLTVSTPRRSTLSRHESDGVDQPEVVMPRRNQRTHTGAMGQPSLNYAASIGRNVPVGDAVTTGEELPSVAASLHLTHRGGVERRKPHHVNHESSRHSNETRNPMEVDQPVLNPAISTGTRFPVEVPMTTRAELPSVTSHHPTQNDSVDKKKHYYAKKERTHPPNERRNQMEYAVSGLFHHRPEEEPYNYNYPVNLSDAHVADYPDTTAEGPPPPSLRNRSAINTEEVRPGAFWIRGINYSPGNDEESTSWQSGPSSGYTNPEPTVGQQSQDQETPALQAQVAEEHDRPTIADEVRRLREELARRSRVPEVLDRTVPDPTNQQETFENEDDEDLSTKRLKRRRLVLGISVFLLVIVVAVVLGVVLSQKDSMQVEEVIRSASPDGGMALDDPKSPQARALTWLQKNKYLKEYPVWRLVQRYALATLFYSTNGEDWTVHSWWLKDEDECIWENKDTQGCDSEGRLVGLDLGGNELSGRIPPEIALLSNSLEFLRLNVNELDGSIPSEISYLSRLEGLFLQGNKLTGGIPSQLGLMGNLKELHLGINLLEGSIPSELGLLTFNLRNVNLGYNNITGSLPSEIGLTRLKDLQISYTSLSGRIPSELGLLTERFERLLLDTNTLTGPIPIELTRMVKLEDLVLSNNTLTGTIPEGFKTMPRLEELKLYNNSFTGTFTCPNDLTVCLISCNNLTVTACRSL